jgi:hypothetical protein
MGGNVSVVGRAFVGRQARFVALDYPVHKLAQPCLQPVDSFGHCEHGAILIGYMAFKV